MFAQQVKRKPERLLLKHQHGLSGAAQATLPATSNERKILAAPETETHVAARQLLGFNKPVRLANWSHNLLEQPLGSKEIGTQRRAVHKRSSAHIHNAGCNRHDTTICYTKEQHCGEILAVVTRL
eukprot:TRINITY_DN1232_c1_g1_i12.p1 TRINITY_DN1232_c1_g1~~TRINITY_DN1232_c1_g1_i12.p1  ORF type:complete len:125 (+),score=23.16 TRINITY_DN1232_c1_g1_i12:375-749(+)